VPPEIEQFAAARSGVSGEMVEGIEPVRPRGGAERAELPDGPDAGRFGAAVTGRFDRSAGLEASSCSIWTASASALRKVLCIWEIVQADRGWPSRPPCSARSR
jgi:hypothetical protein